MDFQFSFGILLKHPEPGFAFYQIKVRKVNDFHITRIPCVFPCYYDVYTRAVLEYSNTPTRSTLQMGLCHVLVPRVTETYIL